MPETTPSEQDATRKFLDRHRDTDEDTQDAALPTLIRSVVEQGIADSVSITELTDGGGVRTRVATDERAAEADRLQYQYSEGPCIEVAFGNDGVLASGDIAAESRWPRWRPAVAAVGIGAVISVELSTMAGAMGAVNLFYNQARTFTTDDIDVATLISGHLSIELAHARHEAHVWKAIDARHLIGQAQGIIMKTYDLDPITSFAVLRRLSQQTNQKLNLIAADIVRTRSVPAGHDTTQPLQPQPLP